MIQKYQKLDTKKKKKKKTLIQKYQYDTIQKYQYVFSSTNLGTKKSAAELWTLYVMKLTGGQALVFHFSQSEHVNPTCFSGNTKDY